MDHKIKSKTNNGCTKSITVEFRMSSEDKLFDKIIIKERVLIPSSHVEDYMCVNKLHPRYVIKRNSDKYAVVEQDRTMLLSDFESILLAYYEMKEQEAISLWDSFTEYL